MCKRTSRTPVVFNLTCWPRYQTTCPLILELSIKLCFHFIQPKINVFHIIRISINLALFFVVFWILEGISPFCGSTDIPFQTFDDISSGQPYSYLAEENMLHPPWDSSLVQHLLTSWWPTWQLNCSLLHTCEQALMQLETGTYHIATHSRRPGKPSTDWTMPGRLNFSMLLSTKTVKIVSA